MQKNKIKVKKYRVKGAGNLTPCRPNERGTSGSGLRTWDQFGGKNTYAHNSGPLFLLSEKEHPQDIHAPGMFSLFFDVFSHFFLSHLLLIACMFLLGFKHDR